MLSSKEEVHVLIQHQGKRDVLVHLLSSVENFFHEEKTLEERVNKLNMNLKDLSSKMPIKLEL